MASCLQYRDHGYEPSWDTDFDEWEVEHLFKEEDETLYDLFIDVLYSPLPTKAKLISAYEKALKAFAENYYFND